MSTFETWLAEYEDPKPTKEVSTDWVAYAGRDQLLQFLQTIAALSPSDPTQQRMVHAALASWVRRAAEAHFAPDHELVESITNVYRAFGESSDDRFQLLQLLAYLGGQNALSRLADLLAQSP